MTMILVNDLAELVSGLLACSSQLLRSTLLLRATFTGILNVFVFELKHLYRC